MELATIEMKREEAVEKLREYRQAARRPVARIRDEADREMTRVDLAVKRGLRELARGNSLLELTPALLAGGVEEITDVPQRWGADVVDVIVPRLAVCRADARYVHTLGVEKPGRVRFFADGNRDRAAACVTVHGFEVNERREMYEARLRALVPSIPPLLRPTHKLSGYHVLFEAEWAVGPPPPPIDPALLKHLGGDLYAVLAVWDLTDLERAVLVNRPEAE